MSNNASLSVGMGSPTERQNIVHGFILGHGNIINKEYIIIPQNFDVFIHTERGNEFHKNIPIENINNSILNRQTHSSHLIRSGTLMEDMFIKSRSFLAYNEEDSRNRGEIVLSNTTSSNLTNISLFTHSGIILDIPTPTHKKPHLTSFYDLSGNASVHSLPNEHGVFEITPGVFGWLLKNRNGTFKKSEVKIINNWHDESMKTIYGARKKLNQSDINKILKISFGSHNSEIIPQIEMINGIDGEGNFRLGYLFKKINEYIKRHPEFNEYKVIMHIYTCRNYIKPITTEANYSLRRQRSFNKSYYDIYGNFKEKISNSIKSIKEQLKRTNLSAVNRTNLDNIISTFNSIVRSYNLKMFFTNQEFEFLENLIENNRTYLIEKSNNYIFRRTIEYYEYLFTSNPNRLNCYLDLIDFITFKKIDTMPHLFSIIDYFIDKMSTRDEKKQVLNIVLEHYERTNKSKLMQILAHYKSQFPNMIQ